MADARIFISHAVEDKRTADAVCAALEGAGLRCWIAPRDIPAGSEWGASIVDGIRRSRAMVLLFSEHTNQSRHIPREVAQAVQADITIIPFRIADVAPTGALDYNLSTLQWLDAFVPPLDPHMERLVSLLGGTPRATVAPGGAPTAAAAIAPVAVAAATPAFSAAPSVVDAMPPAVENAPVAATLPAIDNESVDRRTVTKRPRPVTRIGALAAASGLALIAAAVMAMSTPARSDTKAVEARVTLPAARNADDKTAVLFQEIVTRIRALPGVQYVGATSGGGTVALTLPDGKRVVLSRIGIIGDYLQAAGIPLMQGRAFQESDSDQSVAIVNTPLAASSQIVGRVIAMEATFHPQGLRLTVVGIVDTARAGARADEFANVPLVIVPAAGFPSGEMVLTAKTTTDGAAVAAALPSLVHEVGPDLLVHVEPTRPAGRGWRPWLAAAMALVGIVLAGAAFLLHRRTASPA